jgi:predicted transcriptional regulator
VHVRELAEWVSRSRDTTEQTLRRMEADGIVEHYRGGYWRLR